MEKEASVLSKIFRTIAKFLKITIISAFCLILATIIAVFAVYGRVSWQGNKHIVKLEEISDTYDAIIVPGAQVINNSYPSPMLQDRLDAAIELYQSSVSDRILVSGDHRENNYNEVAVMANYLIEHGVAEEDIFMDHYGLDTYDSIYRSHHVFLIDHAIVVTQTFHLQRALYIARFLGYDYDGYASDLRQYQSTIYSILREYGARLKAVYEVHTDALPTRLDPVMPITGDGRQSHKPWGEPWTN